MKRIIAILVLIIASLAGIIFFQANEKMTQNEIYEEAAVFFQEEDYKKAIQFFEEASEHNNLFSGNLKESLIYYQAEAHMKLGEYEKAILLYDQLLSDSPKEAIPYVLKAYCMIGLGQYEDAVSVYSEGYEKTKDAEFLYYLANQYLTMEQYEDAVSVIHTYRSVENDEIARKLAFLEIVVYEKQQQYDKAYEIATEYCEKYPEDESGQKEKTFLESRR